MSNKAHTPSNLENLDHPPAKVAGGMRVKQPDPHRTPLKAQKHDEDEEKKDKDRLDKLDLEERRAQDMQNHTASFQANVTRNAGKNVHRQYNNPETQPRSLNH
ncbi:hypothetical protein G6F46_009624 [Rhizopus delemar]|uniref:Uncharacterized protein n=3 Tax=Rhizopus TaxID=4842 RepID=I1CSE1_RHIO9|nr:hypothetical protein RO3G_16082 [Rhizopus delemar RA 99-880]KAG1048604.1 hypothetical protein G6F43_009017 [Rhizopus delemar]KAG1538321.1 hypothetical protein G6F51_009842 [Rhizopus arrhizus]KAG1452305.1 hypothetical protein G6F55_008749 [Rhizopus delemar]KAG1492689.1 hypothetical protein G6F54_009122 [Rhizopus delemar]|eukprot:EIE91371.1 hypothetical protein RO3G_16082 [Rhizopus delemar RA 99-880]